MLARFFQRCQTRLAEVLLSVYLFNEHRGFTYLDALAKAFAEKYPEDRTMLAAIRKHAADERNHYRMFCEYFRRRGRLPFRVSERHGYCDQIVRALFGKTLEALDPKEILLDDAAFFRLCRLIMVTEMRGMEQVEVVLKSRLLPRDPELRAIFSVVQKDEPSHCFPYQGWLKKHGQQFPSFWEKLADARVHYSLLFWKIPALFLDRRLPRREDFPRPVPTSLLSSSGMNPVKVLGVLLALSLSAPPARAAIFDAADYLEPGKQAFGLFGEALLSNPTSQGVEGRYRMGLADNINGAAILGSGSDNRGFRLGMEAVFSPIPDTESQLGISAFGTAQYLSRQNYGSLQFRVGPMLNKSFPGIQNNPVNVYLAVPLYWEVHQSTADTGSQLVVGGIWDLSNSHDWYMVTEGGAQLASSESYILLGFGVRFNGQPFGKTRRHKASEEDREYRSEDFEK